MGGKSKELGIEHYFHIGKALHAQEQPLTQEGGFIHVGTLLEQKRQALLLFAAQHQSEQLLFLRLF